MKITADKVVITGFKCYAVLGPEIAYPSLSKLKDRKKKAGMNGTIGYQKIWTQRRA